MKLRSTFKLDTNLKHIIDLYNDLAHIYKQEAGNQTTLYEKERHKESLEYTRCASEARSALSIADLPATYNKVAIAYATINRNEMALYCFKKAALIDEELSPNRSLSTTIYNNIAFLYLKLGNSEQALIYQIQAFTIKENELGENNPNLEEFISCIIRTCKLSKNHKILAEYEQKLLKFLSVDRRDGDHPTSLDDSDNITEAEEQDLFAPTIVTGSSSDVDPAM